MKLRYSVLLLLFMALLQAHAQKVAVKTNILYDATATINGGVEMSVAPKWTIDASVNYNNWKFDSHRWKHWMIQPEARYWFCEKFAGHFLGIHAHGGKYNISDLNADFKFLGTDFSRLKDERFQGWFVGAGVAYGYAWILNKHWNLEAEAGIGYSYTRYDRFPCAECGEKIESRHPHNYVGLTKLAFNLVYLF